MVSHMPIKPVHEDRLGSACRRGVNVAVLAGAYRSSVGPSSSRYGTCRSVTQEENLAPERRGPDTLKPAAAAGRADCRVCLLPGNQWSRSRCGCNITYFLADIPDNNLRGLNVL